MGQKPENMTNCDADKVALVRTVLFALTVALPAACIVANCGRTFHIW